MINEIMIGEIKGFFENDNRISYKDGFAFTSITYPLNNHDAIIIKVDSHSDRITPMYNIKCRTIQEYISYINDKKIAKALIILDDLKILNYCPSLKYLVIYLSNQTLESFSFQPLYDLPEVKMLSCGNEYGDFLEKQMEIDYSKINGLNNLNIDINKKAINYNKIPTLISLNISHFKSKERNLNELFESKNLENLSITQSNIKSLSGIEKSDKLQCLYLYYNRGLEDITDLEKIKGTLKSLVIENCGKIKDFSVLSKLEKLERLTIFGSNVIENINFIKSLKHLRTFTFNMTVLNGDITPCKNLSYVYCENTKRYYNMKNDDLPKNLFVKGNENIADWLKLE